MQPLISTMAQDLLSLHGMKHLFILSLFVFQNAWSADPESRSDSYRMCIHSYYVSGIGFVDSMTSGHGSITIEKNNQRTHSFGFYPHYGAEQGLRVNDRYDGTLPPEGIQWYRNIFANEHPNLQVNEAKFCRSINEADIERTKTLARTYQNRFGDWRLNGNNCVTFAKYIYSTITHDQIVTMDQPRALYNTLLRANEHQVAAIQDLNDTPNSELRQATDRVEATVPAAESAPLER